ncbi:MAG: PAC2 family protein, partial [Microbacteriaceae bacterium]|nr:PAC2 family protein [Microbacteriaceae bacterium]
MTESLFELEISNLEQVPKGLPLVVLLRSMTDIGHTVTGLDDHLWDTCDPLTIARFKADLLLDYRARRPEMMFQRDKLVSCEPEELVLALCTDSLGAQFLLLSGFEPDYRWERFIDCVLMLLDELEVSVTTWVHGLPMPVPHTRPISKTLSGTRETLIDEESDWQPTTRIAGSISHVLEYRLTQLGEDVVGCALLIPHYLA